MVFFLLKLEFFNENQIRLYSICLSVPRTMPVHPTQDGSSRVPRKSLPMVESALQNFNPFFSGQPSTRKSVNHTSSREDAGRNVILCYDLVTRLDFLPFLQNVKRSVICSFLGGLSARNLRFYLSSDNLGCDPCGQDPIPRTVKYLAR